MAKLPKISHIGSAIFKTPYLMEPEAGSQNRIRAYLGVPSKLYLVREIKSSTSKLNTNLRVETCCIRTWELMPAHS